MATKKKTVEFKADAIDGDGDGLVQDGTEWERPLEDTQPVEVVKPAKATEVVMVEGENILTIAKRHCPAGQTWQEYAKTLASLNGSVAPGKVIRLG